MSENLHIQHWIIYFYSLLSTKSFNTAQNGYLRSITGSCWNTFQIPNGTSIWKTWNHLPEDFFTPSLWNRNKPTFSLLVEFMLRTHISSATTKQHLVDMAIVDSSRNTILLHRHDATETVIGRPNLSVKIVWRFIAPGVLESSGKIGGPFFGVCNNGWYCVLIYHLVFKFQECWVFIRVISLFLPIGGVSFVSCPEFHKHNFPKKTIHPKTNNDTWTWWFSKFRISFRGPPFSGATLVFVEETSSISSSFCTKRKPNF